MTLRATSQHYQINSQDSLAIALCDVQRFLEAGKAEHVRSVLSVTKFDPSTQRQQEYFYLIMRALETSVLWHGAQLTARQWEDLLIAAWRKEFLVPGLLGGFAFVGGCIERLSRESCSEVLYLAEEFLAKIGLSLSGRSDTFLNVIQTGSELSDLVLAPENKTAIHGGGRQEPSRQRHSPWSNVTWRDNASLPDELLYSSEETVQEA